MKIHRYDRHLIAELEKQNESKFGILNFETKQNFWTFQWKLEPRIVFVIPRSPFLTTFSPCLALLENHDFQNFLAEKKVLGKKLEKIHKSYLWPADFIFGGHFYPNSSFWEVRKSSARARQKDVVTQKFRAFQTMKNSSFWFLHMLISNMTLNGCSQAKQALECGIKNNKMNRSTTRNFKLEIWNFEPKRNFWNF